MKIDWLKIIGAVSIVVLVCLIGYGAYEFYFEKPIPIINNTTVQSGGQVHVEQSVPKVSKSGHLYTGVYGGKSGNGSDLGIEIGWLW